MLRKCCSAALCASLLAPVAWGQDKPAAPGASKPQAAKPAPKASKSLPQKPAVEPENAGVKTVEEIFACVAQGLPDGWRRAWVTVTELSGSGKERTFEGRFQVSLESVGEKRWDFVPCNARNVAERVYGLNDFLEPEKRQWKVATLLYTNDGKFEIKYDYTR